MSRQVGDVAIIPRRLGISVEPRLGRLTVPADAETIPIGRFRSLTSRETLRDERVLGLQDQVLKQYGGTGVCDPATDGGRLIFSFVGLD